jgi:predicted small metal-binding protein
MAYSIQCKDTGADCEAVLRADTMDELQQKIADHGKDVHNMDLASMPEEQKQQLMSLIKQE